MASKASLKLQHNVKHAAPSKQIKSGVVNLGYTYESLVPAYFALELLRDPDIKSFTFIINSSSFKKLDDLIISIENNLGKTESFAIQLKHRQTERDILEAEDEFNSNRKKQKQNFVISEYQDAFAKVDKTTRDSHKFILFTNVTFINLDKVTNYTIEKPCKGFMTNFFNMKDVYQFEEKNQQKKEDNSTFSKNFFLFSAQKNVKQLNETIKAIFKTDFYSDETNAICFMTFFRELREKCYGDTTITRDAVILELVKLLVSKHKINTPLHYNDDSRIKMITEAIKLFDLTVIQESDKRVVENNWGRSSLSEHTTESLEKFARDFKILREGDILTEQDQHEILCYKEYPMFVYVDRDCKQKIYKVVRLCKTMQHCNIKFVILVNEKINDKEFVEWKIFRTLTDLKTNDYLYQKFLMTFHISLQGRVTKSLTDLKTIYDLHLDKFITMKEIFPLLENEGNLLIGEKLEELPEFHIQRALLKTRFNYKYLKTMCEENSVIVHCEGESKSFRQIMKNKYPNLLITDMATYERNPGEYEKNHLILTEGKIRKNIENCFHQLKFTKENSLEWLQSKIKPDNEAIFDNQLNAVCSNPGVGKTTMMKYLAYRCPLNYWVVVIPLKQLNNFFIRNYSTREILKHFVYKDLQRQTNVVNIIKYFQSKKKLMFLFDGLDELNKESITRAVNVINDLVKDGYKIWVFCTKRLQNVLENDLNVYSIYNIEELKQQDQKDYIRHRLQTTKNNNAEQIIKKIFENNSEEINKLNTIILKVPLRLYIMTEIACEEKTFNDLENILTFSGMYPYFIEGKLQHNLQKAGYDQNVQSLSPVINLFKHFYIKECRIGALKSCLEPDLFESFHIRNDKTFLQHVRENGDFLGFIFKINEDNTFIFNHHSFAEYFAAMWLSENFAEIPTEKLKFMFQPKYNGVRYFFDVKLAQNRPLHLSILNHDVTGVKSMAQKHVNKLDHGGRTPLHLAVSIGKKHPILENSSGQLKTNLHQDQSKSYTNHEQILKYLLGLKDAKPLQKDKLFQWSSFEYADASLSLLSLEELSKKQQIEFSQLTAYHDLNSLCYYCVTLGYINLLRTLIIPKGLAHLAKLHKPLLHLALEFGQKDSVILLVRHGITLNAKDSQQRMALHEAALWGHCDMVELLLDNKADIEAQDCMGKSPLQFAAKMGHKDIVEFLVKKGANINTNDSAERTPLHKASYMGKSEVVEYLIKNGANVNSPDNENKAALQRAAEMGHCETVKCLIENGANKNAVDKNKRSALHYAASEGHLDVVKFLIGQNINIYLTDEDDKTATQVADLKKNKDISEFLKNAAKHYPSSDLLNEKTKISHLHEAAEKGDVEKIRQMLDEGVDVETIDHNNETILHVACYNGHENLVNYLLEQGANTAAVNHEKRVPLHLAAQRGYVGIVKKMLDTRELLIVTDKWGFTPLHRAAYKGHEEIVKLLMDAGSDVSSVTYKGGTALHGAARGGHNAVFDYLISQKADIEAVDNDGKTCLHVAAQKGCTETVEHLIKKMKITSLDAIDSRGRSALHWAAEKGYTIMIRHLVEAGANINTRDYHKQTALDIAVNAQRKEIVEYLKDQNKKNPNI